MNHLKQIWKAFCGDSDNSDLHPKSEPAKPKPPQHKLSQQTQSQQLNSINQKIAIGAAGMQNALGMHGIGASAAETPRVVIDSSAVNLSAHERLYYERQAQRKLTGQYPRGI
jgi:hypothetical protein